MSSAFTIITFYKFVTLSDFRELKGPLLQFLVEQEIRGTILLAEEGINGTVSGSDASIKSLMARFREDERFADLEYKYGEHHEQPFKKTKVKLKKEIISFGRHLQPTQPVGTYLDHEQWNTLLSDESVIVIDARNNYEVELGNFPGSINPNTDNFRQLADFADEQIAEHRDAKIAMYCTGGIRCEKFSSYLIDKGFKNVFHLKGGILKYLAEVPESKNRWNGTCYVFDDRRFLK
jgi:UPF0176 protein